MSLAAVLISAAAFLFSMEMWGRKHPPARAAAPAAADSLEWVDRFQVPDSGALVPAVGAYLDFVAVSGSQGGLIHNYINDGMHNLNRALMAVSGLNLRVGTVDRMQLALGRYADTLRAHPRWALDPNRVRPAMLMAVEIMRSQNIAYDEALRDRIRKAEDAALALDPKEVTLWQRPKIQDFFIQTGFALVLIKERMIAGNGGKTTPNP
jgi:hypothetical protein